MRSPRVPLTPSLPSPTDDTRRLVQAALWILKQLFKANFNYAKAGVMLGELVPMSGVQMDLFSQTQLSSKTANLMIAMDEISRKMGKESIKLASEGFKRPWKMKQEIKSQISLGTGIS